MQKDSDRATSGHKEGFLKLGSYETKERKIGYFRPSYLISQLFFQKNTLNLILLNFCP